MPLMPIRWTMAYQQWLSRLNPRQLNSVRLVVVIAIVTMIRIVALLLTHGAKLGDNAVDDYLPAARHILSGHGFNDVDTREYCVVAPGYPYFLATIFSIFGENLAALRMIQILLDATTAGLVVLIADLLHSRKAALWAGIGYGLYPMAIHYSLAVSAETLFTLLLTAFVYALVVALQSQERHWYVVAGLLLAAATLTRSTSLFLLVLLIPLAAGAGRWSLRAWLSPLLMAGIVAVAVAAWGTRNLLVIGEFIPVQANSGATFLNGSDERFWTIAGKNRYREPFARSMSAHGIVHPASTNGLATDRWYWRIGLERYRMRLEGDGAPLLPFLIRKFLYMWYASEAGHSFRILGAIHFPLLALFLIGLPRFTYRAPASAWLPVCIVAYFVAAHLVMQPMVRYLAPAMPCLLIVAAGGLSNILAALFGGHPSTNEQQERGGSAQTSAIDVKT